MLRKLTPVLVLWLALSGPSAAAEEDGRTLKERIQSVSNRLYGKSGRLELTLYPMTSLSLNDAFYQKFGGGLGLAYHFSESLSASLFGTYNLSLETSNASYYGHKEEYVPFAGKRTFLGGLDFMWAPLYGKVSLAAEWIMHFDTYILAGIGFIGNEQAADKTSFGFSGAFGLGARFFFTPMVALRLEVKDYVVFNDEVTFKTQSKTGVQQQLLFNIGLSLFFLDGDAED